MPRIVTESVIIQFTVGAHAFFWRQTAHPAPCGLRSRRQSTADYPCTVGILDAPATAAFDAAVATNGRYYICTECTLDIVHQISITLDT